MAESMKDLFGPAAPVENKERVEIKERELAYTPPDRVMGKLKDGKGVEFTYDKTTQVAIRDSKGHVSIFAKNERSAGTVNMRLYGFYQTKRYGEGRRKEKAPKPFVASVVPFEPDPNKGFVPFVNHDKEGN